MMKTDTDHIFDTFFKLSDLVQRKDRINKLIRQNKQMLNACGSCNKWMTKKCPREANHKVHCNELICSTHFSMDAITLNILNKNIAEIETLSNITQ